MGTSCLCSILHKIPLNYPYCTVSYCPKQLPPTTTSVSSNNVCHEKQTCLSVIQRQQHTRCDPTSRLWGGGWGVRRPYSTQNPVTAAILAAAAAACVMIVAVNGVEAAEIGTQQEINGETLSNIPQLLSGECVDGNKDCKKARIQRPKSRQAETCTVKCVNTCIRGGLGSPGEGPLNVRSYCPKQLQPTSTSVNVCQKNKTRLSVTQQQNPITAAILAAAAAACVMMVAVNGVEAAEFGTQQEINGETLSNIPQLLSGECVDGQKDCKKARIQRPKSRQAEICSFKCLNSCIRGGLGSPGEGPLNAFRPLVVFKQGFRSRQYCLVECSDICNLIRDGEDGP